jgi:hypothetical protein
MMKYVYTVWFRDPDTTAEDPDWEWPSCFVIQGTSEFSAKDWGDRLAVRYSVKSGQEFLRSSIERLEDSTLPAIDSLPVIREGQDTDDEEIGW